MKRHLKRMSSAHDAAPLLLTRRQVADKLNISERTLYNLTASGEISAVRVGRRVSYRQDAVAAFVAGLETAGAGNAN